MGWLHNMVPGKLEVFISSCLLILFFFIFPLLLLLLRFLSVHDTTCAARNAALKLKKRCKAPLLEKDEANACFSLDKKLLNHRSRWLAFYDRRYAELVPWCPLFWLPWDSVGIRIHQCYALNTVEQPHSPTIRELWADLLLNLFWSALNSMRYSSLR